MDLSAGLVEHCGRAVRVGDLVGEIHIVEFVEVKAADSEHVIATHTHARADQVGCRSQSVRKPLVVAAEHPLEFGREPGRPGRGVVRPWRTADGHGSRARGVHGEQSLEPVRFRFGVVVEEGDDVSAGE